jgi:glucosamine--fructose-6-phosphate aminotransferase (isomerizing)
MCGIVAYVGKRDVFPILIKGLTRLEYRGYDSAGVAILNKNKLNVYKKKGKVNDLTNWIGKKSKSGNIGIGHTRWATHGEPNDINSHPHSSTDGSFAIIHNGIIENYSSLKKELISRGYKFKSQTDTEVVVHLIDDIRKTSGVTIEEAFKLSLNSVVGAYALVLVSKETPNQLLAARKSSPLVIGIGKDEYFLASDATPIIEYTNSVVYLNDGEIAVLNTETGLKVTDLNNEEKNPYIQTLELKLNQIEKEGWDHFMIKEIFEQPRSIYDCFRGRLNSSEGFVQLGGLKDYEQQILKANKIIFVACGTSWHASQVGEYLIEGLARIPVEVEYASEFRYRNPIINEGDIIIAISQSGETADTLAALELAKSKGALIFGICNVVGSSISRITDAGSYTHAGPEIGVASTKAFTAQVTVLTLLALRLAQLKETINLSDFRRILTELETIPEKVKAVLEKNDVVKEISNIYKDSKNALYLGRGSSFPVALEGALKLKEISYIHAEGYPAAEMKHGPIALIDNEMPVIVVATKGSSYEKVVSNIQEVKARGGKLIAIVTEGDKQVSGMVDHIIEIPEVDENLVPLISTIPLQLLSYHIAVMRGCNVDQPRNLAKSVTVE